MGTILSLCSEFALTLEKITSLNPFGLVDSAPCGLDSVDVALLTWRNLSYILVLIFSPMFQVYANGIRNIDLHYIIRKLAAPVISVLLLSLCVPYVIASGVVPLLGG